MFTVVYPNVNLHLWYYVHSFSLGSLTQKHTHSHTYNDTNSQTHTYNDTNPQTHIYNDTNPQTHVSVSNFPILILLILNMIKFFQA